MIRLTVLLLTLAAGSSQQAASFWFTDTSLFQAPLQQAAHQLFGQQQSTEAKQQLQAADRQQAASAAGSASSSQVELLAKSSEPWVRLEPAVVPVVKRTQPMSQQQQQEPGAQGALAALQFQQQQQCQCRNDWLRNQTGAYLDEWLASPNVASQMRLLLLASNSTGAVGPASANSSAEPHRGRDAHHGNNGNGNNHWAAWIKSKGGNANGAQARTARNKQHGQQQQVITKQPDRGPQGPKGEQGARGERGPSGLISVKDRNGLFDLPTPTAPASLLQLSVAASASADATTISSVSNSSGDKQKAATTMTTPNEQQQQQVARLVFIEAEQMLVVGTEAGWRPVQMLAPLRDFRNAIAKFSLSSPEDRRRLISSAAAATGRPGTDNSIKPLRRHEEVAASNVARGAPVGADRSQNELTAYGGSGAADLADEEDDDGEEVDDDEDDDDDEEEDEDEDDMEDMDEDNDVGGNDLGNSDKQRQRQTRRRLTAATSGSNQTPTANGQVVSGRSATAAALVSTSIGDNSARKLQREQQTMMAAAAAAESPSRRGNGSSNADKRVMKLRMAALNEPFSGNVHGIRGADFECKRNAAKANVKGSFRAFLAAGFQSLNEVVRYNVHKYPIVNLRGESLANSWHDLFKQPARIANPLSRIYSFDGRHVATDSKWPNKLVWHGAANKAGYRDLVQNCDGWHSDSLNKFGLATPVHPSRIGGSAPTMKTRRQRKRYLAELAANAQAINNNSNIAATNNNQTSSQMGGEHGGLAFLEGIEKYPCRMPLIVLCIETIGQQFSEQQWNNRRFAPAGGNSVMDGDESLESNNMVPL